MSQQPGPIVAAGHICLDLIPEFASGLGTELGEILSPGSLVNVGPVLTSTGGSVANTGLALFKLGNPVRFAGKVGDDAFGKEILRILATNDDVLAKSMIVDAKSHSSYTVVISPPNVDRVFLHHPGANDTFSAQDIKPELLNEASLFHFGYPPLMQRMYENDGVELMALMTQVRRMKVPTSLDMSMPDPSTPSGKADWPKIFKSVLPQVDIFMPSIDELEYMLRDKVKFDESTSDVEKGRKLGQWCVDAGAAVVAVKLGSEGLCLVTSNDKKRFDLLQSTTNITVDDWTGKNLFTTCFKVDLAGATGAGDCTIAGLLDAVRRGLSPEDCLNFATAVGACSCEAPDATGGLISREKIENRIAKGWEKREPLSIQKISNSDKHEHVFSINSK